MLNNYFTYKELTKTSVKEVDNTPNYQAKRNLVLLRQNILNPLRIAARMPIYVNSGYRSKYVNWAVGGVDNSQHCEGKAADIRCHDYNSTHRLQSILYNMMFDQVIIYDTFIHVSFNRGYNRRQWIDKRKGR